MLPLRAEIHSDAPVLDQRSAARRILRLEVAARTSDETSALIHNLSETGLLLETSVGLQVGEALQVELPHAGVTRALVVWSQGRFVGCEFFSPISKAAVSAALLRTPIERAQPAVPATPSDEADQSWPSEEPSLAAKAVLLFSLVVSLMVALGLVVALLTAPFST